MSGVVLCQSMNTMQKKNKRILFNTELQGNKLQQLKTDFEKFQIRITFSVLFYKGK